jgi:hypothetical protein
MKTLKEIIENNISVLEKNKKWLMNRSYEEAAEEIQININILLGILSEHKNQKKEDETDETY